jgi:hypothetical protein
MAVLFFPFFSDFCNTALFLGYRHSPSLWEMNETFYKECSLPVVSNRFFSYQVASDGAIVLSMLTCAHLTPGNSLEISSLSASASTRCSHGSPMAGFSFYMPPLHLLAETLQQDRQIFSMHS